MLPFIPAQMSVEQKGLGDSAMGDGVHATVSVEQPITVQDQSSQTTYRPKDGEKACPCCQFYGVPCRKFVRLKMKLQLGGTCNTRFIKGHKPSNHIRARIKSHVYTTE